ncbi:MAG TPA: asparagine synthase (glutamine-hydrolyzing) [Tepidisphaeraceae bacterium]|nr:asparagine synthase (glutamine-hydrolyzing) [Tepidisphaeraceae bacterium]
MCGFAGIVSWSHRHRVDRAVLERMNARIAHRGPDGEGIWLSHDGEPTPANPQVGLAHRRLAIIDLDPRANQPFTDDRGRWVVYNGEIYNYRELRRELERLLPDYRWKTECDTEVLLAAYEAWGDKCVDHLNGMFALAIWDGPKGELFLARDRMGQKPLYYTTGMGSIWTESSWIAFASEMPALHEVRHTGHQLTPTDAPSLREVFGTERELSKPALAQYLRWGCSSPADGHSVIRGAIQLAPAHRLSVSASRWGMGRYFDPNSAPRGTTADVAARALTRERVTRAVERQLVADVPVGCFLSGGVDSSVIASSMCRLRDPREVLTFSIGFDDARYDERPYARAVAEHLGTRHHDFTVRPNAIDDLPKLAAVFGEPFADSSALPTHYLARETRAHVKVALSGDGGDELFGGYDRYRAMAIGQRFARMPRGVWRVAAAVARVTGGASAHPKSLRSRVHRLLRTGHLDLWQRYASYLELFDRSTLKELWPDSVQFDPLWVGGEYVLAAHHREPAEAAAAADRVTYLPDDLLTKVDRASMLHNLEVRSPFMDHELVEFAATLTTPQLLRGSPKRMLREAFAADLPPFVFKRKKMGFAVPIGEWFRGPLRAMLRDHLFAADSFARGHFHMPVVERLIAEHEAERVDHSQRLYALLMLELWWRTMRDDR